jgi:ribosomal-protein-alanine N-acetyltransferase
MEYTYNTERLQIKVLDKTSADMVLDYYSRNKSFLSQWEPIRNEEFYSIPFHEELLQKYLHQTEQGTSLRLWIFKKDDPGRIIGTIGFNNIVRGAFLSCHLGYSLDKDEINKGYMTEALISGIDMIFNEFGLHRIEANIMPKNLRSLKVVEKLGFYNEGMAYSYLKINGQWEDHIHMVLLNENV